MFTVTSWPKFSPKPTGGEKDVWISMSWRLSD